MESSDSETESLRLEQGKRGDEGSAGDQAVTSMSLGSMIRGPIGREGAAEDASGSERADADREAAQTEGR